MAGMGRAAQGDCMTVEPGREPRLPTPLGSPYRVRGRLCLRRNDDYAGGRAMSVYGYCPTVYVFPRAAVVRGSGCARMAAWACYIMLRRLGLGS